MSMVTTQRVKLVPLDVQEPLAIRIARAVSSTSLVTLPVEVVDKTKICLLDLIGCAFEARNLPWSRQAVGLAQAAASQVEWFKRPPEILAVYHKPVPACNFAQTPCQAALQLNRDARVTPHRVTAVTIRVPRAGALYPGCDYTCPFAHILQAKMSIQYNVAAAPILGNVSEKNFKLLNDPLLHRLIAITKLEVDDALTRAYPALQGGEVEITETGGTLRRIRLANVINATASDVRDRFQSAATNVVGAERTGQIERFVDTLERQQDAGALGTLLRVG